jgi:hypothetical protein
MDTSLGTREVHDLAGVTLDNYEGALLEATGVNLLDIGGT